MADLTLSQSLPYPIKTVSGSRRLDPASAIGFAFALFGVIVMALTTIGITAAPLLLQSQQPLKIVLPFNTITPAPNNNSSVR